MKNSASSMVIFAKEILAPLKRKAVESKGEIMRNTQSSAGRSGSCLLLLRSLRFETNYPFYENPALSDMSPLTNVKSVLMVSDDSPSIYHNKEFH